MDSEFRVLYVIFVALALIVALIVAFAFGLVRGTYVGTDRVVDHICIERGYPEGYWDDENEVIYCYDELEIK